MKRLECIRVYVRVGTGSVGLPWEPAVTFPLIQALARPSQSSSLLNRTQLPGGAPRSSQPLAPHTPRRYRITEQPRLAPPPCAAPGPCPARPGRGGQCHLWLWRLGETRVTEPLKHLPLLTQKLALQRIRHGLQQTARTHATTPGRPGEGARK